MGIRFWIRGGPDEGKDVGLNLSIAPNPFNPITTVKFYAERDQRVLIAVYNIRGYRVATLTDQQYEMGEHSVEWQGRDSAGRAVPSGQYFFRVVAGDDVHIKKALLLK